MACTRFKPGRCPWIRWRVPAAPDAERWYLKEAAQRRAGPGHAVHAPRERGWSQRSAGDRVAVNRLAAAAPGIPILPLAVSAADASYYALRIEASNSFSTPLQFVSEPSQCRTRQRISCLHGICFGLLAMWW
ncbi:MAG: hypothetical protein IPK34_09545 [Ramlibacter sp.]|nr:hypothetical protein [Ramlibacter sp.]